MKRHQYMKLIETVDAILAGLAVTTKEDLPSKRRLQLVETKCQQGTSYRARFRPDFVGHREGDPFGGNGLNSSGSRLE